MSKTDAFENDLLLLIFNNTDIANIGDAAGLQNSAAAGSLYLSLHSADPGEAGTQNTNEVTYSGYARQAVARSGAGFTVSGNSVVLASAVNFPLSSGGGSNATHFGVGVSSSGANRLLYKGALNNTIPCSSAGVTPTLGTGTTVTED
jgi:hypothetical protein